MIRNRKSKKNKLYIKIIFILLALAIITIVVKNTFAKYTSTGTSTANVDVALYLLGETRITQNLKIDELLPRTEPYTYTFSIANNDGTNRAQTLMEYDLKIVMTTNLPLTYRIYKNQVYTDSGATDIIVTNTVATDDDGTYFRTITLPTGEFGFTTNETDTYQIVVNFPIIYNSAEYENVIENLEITVNSRQKIKNP